MACDVFILITGLYMNKHKDISRNKIMLLLFEMLFYSLFGIIVSMIIGNDTCSKLDFIKSVFPIL